MYKYMNRLKFIFRFKNFIPFLKDFFLSNEIPLRKKVIGIVLIVIYVLFPFDLIPDFILFFGVIDDIVVATFVLERMVKLAPQHLKDKYRLID
ncbi:DUF1232 domain-containing protein [Anaerobacillus alkaliphilus]|uniref:DUF1232 domain-containing protein n=1 Tax=Anaerobacillus alkaliphilus TaxID=1548597 RepID=A0A4Q0VUP2_9BACI|nr:DUF1232 domain-containing protein [Anaerobacillus alkaliphilus]RXJ02097.1 DUF1232 domain-containing protein [Anaerobacillus alkaliphilus]